VALLEARDLLFARLLAYRAFKEVSVLLAGLADRAAQRRARDVALEAWVAALLPEVRLGLTPQEFAQLASTAFAPKPAPPGVSVSHVHAPAVSVAEQASLLASRLRRVGHGSFTWLVADAASTLVVVGRFLALLELYREGVLAFEQAAPLGELMIRWVGGDGPLMSAGNLAEPGAP
jgi:segregation and condensation protein A